MRYCRLRLLAFLLLTGALYLMVYAPDNFVWNNDPTLLRQIAPSLRTVLAMRLLLLGSIGLVGLRPLRWQRRVAWLLLGGGWVLAERLLPSCLAAEYYAIWKYEFTTEEYSEPTPPIGNAQVVSLLLHDVRSSTESVRIRSKIALLLGEARIQVAYPALVAIVQDRHQNPYLRFHCLKSLRLLRPQQFSAVLDAAPPDSALLLYRKYTPH